MHPELFRVGPLVIQSYGFMLAVAFLAVLFIARAEFRRRGGDPKDADPLVMVAIIGGIVGARIYFLLEQWDMFVRYPREMIFSRGGLVWYGGLGLGVLSVVLMARRKGLRLSMVADSAAPAIALGYAITRIGCFLNGCCYGRATSVPWGVHFPGNPICESGSAVHPTQLYESGSSFVIFAILWSVRKRPLPSPSLFYMYLILGGTERFLVEFVRATPRVALGLSMAQFLSAGIVAFGAISLVNTLRGGKMRRT